MTWTLATLLVAAYLIVWAIDQARHMSWRTCHRIRLGVVLIGAASMSAAIAPLYHHHPQWLLPAFMAGTALLLWGDRRGRRQ